MQVLKTSHEHACTWIEQGLTTTNAHAIYTNLEQRILTHATLHL